MTMRVENGRQQKIFSASEVLRLFEAAHPSRVRLVSIFGSQSDNGGTLHYLADVPGEGYREFQCPVSGPVPSLTAICPAAAWHEREVHEQFGVEFQGHPALLPLARHSQDADDPRFLKVQGKGVCEVPVGPVHAGIIEPGHFRFSVIGDTVLHLQLQLFYTHKGTEKLFCGALAAEATPLAESVSGDNCFAHAVAYCRAVEEIFQVAVPARAEAVRLVGLELERLLAHIGDFGALCNDVAFTVPAAYCARIKEDLLQASTRSMGTRYWRGIAVPGGVQREPSSAGARDLRDSIRAAAADFFAIADQALNTPSAQDRFEGAGVLTPAAASDLAVVGPAARASAISFDVRRDHPYGAYKALRFDVPTLHYGDVMARARIRVEEARASVRLILDCLKDLSEGPIRASLTGTPSGAAHAAVESPRGELLYWLKLEEGRIQRCHVRSPSFQNWPALPLAVTGNIIADFPLINKSFNLSYSGCDR
ncbi:MAG TPA: NADH-quinone oxidoreductase subunit C [Candidatus Angelobacter sp.]